MVQLLSTIFYIILFLGLYKLVFKQSRVGCLFIIVSLVLFNIFAPDGYDTDKKVRKASYPKEDFNSINYKNSGSTTYLNYESVYDSINNNYHSNESNSDSNHTSQDKNESYRDNRYNDSYEEKYFHENESIYMLNNEYKQVNGNYKNQTKYHYQYKKPQIHEYRERIGAVCNDGTTTNATSSGACSHHGGVAYWLYE